MSAQARTRKLSPTPIFCVLGLMLGGCGGSESETPSGETTADAVIRRDRAAAYFAQLEYTTARDIILPLVQVDHPEVQDLTRAASIYYELGEIDRAQGYLVSASAISPDDPEVRWGLFRHAFELYQLDEALEHLQVIHAAHPDDIPARLRLAVVLKDLGLEEEAAPHFEVLTAMDLDYAGSWLKAAVYHAASFHRDFGRMDEFDRLMDRWESYDRSGITTPTQVDLRHGTFGTVRPGRLGQLAIAPQTPLAAPGAAASVLAMNGARGLLEVWPERAPLSDTSFQKVLEDGNTRDVKFAKWPRRAVDILVFGSAGLSHATRKPNGAWSSEVVLEGDILAAAACDLPLLDVTKKRGSAPLTPTERDGFLELVVARSTASGAEVLLLQRTEEWSPVASPIFECDAAVRSLIAVDHDHDGDVDLIVAHGERVTLLRNDGAAGDGQGEGGFVPSEQISWPAGAFAVQAVDLDGDNDLDFALLGDGQEKAAVYLSSERSKGFLEAPALLPGGISLNAGRSLFDDVDQDGRPDLVVAGSGLALHFRTVGKGWTAPISAGSETATGAPIAVDWDLDGTTDILWPAGEQIGFVQAAGFDERLAGSFEAGVDAPLIGLHAADLDGDFAPDLLLLTENGLFERISSTERRGLLLELRGDKDNQRGVGATVEVRARDNYRRLYWRGQPMLLSVGDGDRADILRVTWPNGVVQTEADLGAGQGWLIEQAKGLVGSCPFLYTWNGETYEYISDVLGITPLGLPMGDGQLVPPDHDEYVLVRGEQLAPRDGFFELQFTEELREVTYLDRIRLDVIDHPEEIEIFPNERFTFPPFPEAHTHTVQEPLSPRSALGSDGRDWTAELSANDESFAAPFEPHGGQFLGLATPHWIEIEFDPERVRAAKSLRLVMNGWFFWTDASVNMAAARTPGVDFIPPLLQVPDGKGGWMENGPPLGFPAGKLKTMVIDVTGRIDPENPRLRIFGALRLYWDSIRLAVDDDAGELRVTSIEPHSAELWERGFSRPIPTHGEFALDWFDWNELAEEPRWNQHPGLYTRLGECVPLLGVADDRFVIMGAGDALLVRFPAEGLPELPEGWRRDYLVYLDGWAKDRDPNSHEAEYVEPLPFHGMSAYPYGEDEAFPSTEQHEAWRREWNTRPGKQWIVPLHRTARTPAGIGLR